MKGQEGIPIERTRQEREKEKSKERERVREISTVIIVGVLSS